MTKISAAGLVIREGAIGEADRMITVLTAEHGLVRAFSRGAKKTGSKKLSATALLTYSDFTFSRSKDTWSVEDAEAKELFYELRTDVEKMALAQYLCELGFAFCEEEFESGEILRLFLNALYFIKTGVKEPGLVKAVTELRLLSLSGYLPNLVACDVCGEYETDPMWFSVEEGKLYCNAHKPASLTRLVPLSVVRAMRHIIYSEFEKVFFFSLAGDSLPILEAVSEEYMCLRAQRKFKTLDFYHGVRELT